MLDFAIRVDGLSAAERLVDRLVGRFANLLPLMDRIGELLVGNTKHRFETETAPDGQKWKTSKRAEGDGGKTLTVDGHLRDSITHLAAPRQVEIGTNLIYARIHQLGGTIVPKNAGALVFRMPDGALVHASKVIIPARPFLGFDAVDARGVERLTESYAAEAATS